MAMRRRRIDTLYTTFTNNLNSSTIEDYFKVPGKYKLHRTAPDVLCFEVDYEYIPPCIGDCKDVSIYIASFLYTRSTCKFSIVFNNSYPFHPTIWNIFYVKTNENVDFYKALTFQTQQYNLSWSPAITIETDILNMIIQLLMVR